ncbi:hypothetical protein [Pengzhenrongella phosphoraccumulans]|uniref:hypothetical protein n=1 Tax=Pengzhenrongella phosphoraccumulans TaxID=3114394 RepID=UPI00388FD94F
MRTKTRIAATVATGVVATVLMASPGLAASGQAASAVAGKGQQTSQQVGTCDGTGARLQDRDTTGDHLHLRIHQA